MDVSLDWKPVRASDRFKLIEREVTELPLVAEDQAESPAVLGVKLCDEPGPSRIGREELHMDDGVRLILRGIEPRDCPGKLMGEKPTDRNPPCPFWS